MRTVTQLYQDPQDVQPVLTALDRRGFTGRDVVWVIDYDKISAEDAAGGRQRPLGDALQDLGVSPDKVDQYATALKQGGKLVFVKAAEDRAAEAASIMEQTGVKPR